jgi:hypothetical protein
MGSAVHFLAQNPVCPVLIVKNEITRKMKPSFTWLVCTDGSDKSFKAFEQALKLINKDVDKVIGLFVKEIGAN